jgi:hypothetical protein
VSKVIVYHDSYGCETGCCGHRIELVPEDLQRESWTFDHPRDTYGRHRSEADREFAERIIREELGEEHVADLDWENSLVVDD